MGKIQFGYPSISQMWHYHATRLQGLYGSEVVCWDCLQPKVSTYEIEDACCVMCTWHHDKIWMATIWFVTFNPSDVFPNALPMGAEIERKVMTLMYNRNTKGMFWNGLHSHLKRIPITSSPDHLFQNCQCLPKRFKGWWSCPDQKKKNIPFWAGR